MNHVNVAIRSVVATIVVIAAAGCASTGPTRQPAPEILVTAAPDTVVARRTPEGVYFNVSQRVVNAGSATAYFETCPTAGLQRLVDGVWKDAQSRVCSLMLRPPRPLAPGAQVSFEQVFGGSSGVPPAFPWADAVAGTYRLTFSVRRDSSLTGHAYHKAVSNPFVVRLP